MIGHQAWLMLPTLDWVIGAWLLRAAGVLYLGLKKLAQRFATGRSSASSKRMQRLLNQKCSPIKQGSIIRMRYEEADNACVISSKRMEDKQMRIDQHDPQSLPNRPGRPSLVGLGASCGKKSHPVLPGCPRQKAAVVLPSCKRRRKPKRIRD